MFYLPILNPRGLLQDTVFYSVLFFFSAFAAGLWCRSAARALAAIERGAGPTDTVAAFIAWFSVIFARKVLVCRSPLKPGVKLCQQRSEHESCPLIRWGIIGCGAVTEIKSGPAYQQTAGFEIGMVMRRDAAKAADYAARHQIARWTTDAQALIDDPAIDAIYIATPPDSHLAYALKVAAAGKICCVEKPMALNSLNNVQQMIDAFQKAGLPLFVAYYRRSLPRFRQVQFWLQQGRIGPVRHVQWNFSRTTESG